MPRRHWTEKLQCHVCGQTFRSMISEAKHRHNFPAMCKRNKQFAAHMAKYFPEKKESTDAPAPPADLRPAAGSADRS